MEYFDTKTLNKIAAVICGDDLKSKYCVDDDNCPFYRRGSELSEFFQNAGLECEPHDGSTRKTWTLERLKEYNEDSSKIQKILLRLASPLEYSDKNSTETVIKELNNILFAEGYEILLKGAKPCINGINSDNSNEDLNESKTRIKNNKDKNLIKVFISYSMNDKLVGAKIKEILASFGIECFMAHDDIGVSEEWKIRIINELNEADIFIPILSDNFKKSDWCSQEAGIACFRDILFIPLTLDKQITPYGFMSHRQGKLISQNYIPLNYLINPILDNFPAVNIFGNLIDELKIVDGYRNAENLMYKLEPYFDKLNDNEIKKVVDISIANNQIWDANRCKSVYLPKFIKFNKDKIEDNKLKELSKLIEY